jgi:hypothetical protein
MRSAGRTGRYTVDSETTKFTFETGPMQGWPASYRAYAEGGKILWPAKYPEHIPANQNYASLGGIRCWFGEAQKKSDAPPGRSETPRPKAGRRQRAVSRRARN